MVLMKKLNLDSPATKGDLEKLVTKKEFRRELGKLVTKKEFSRALAKLATKEELNQLEQVLRSEIRLTAKETKEEIKEEISQSQSQILDTLDKFLKELEVSRQERTIAAHQLSRTNEKLENHERRIAVLEEKIPSSP